MGKLSKTGKPENPSSAEAAVAGKKTPKRGKNAYPKEAESHSAKTAEQGKEGRGGKAAEKPSTSKTGRAYPITLHIDAVKGALRQSVSDYKNDIDPDKASAFKKEAVTALKKLAAGSVVAIAAAAILIIPETYYDGKVMARTSVAGVSMGSVEASRAKSSLLVETDRFMKTPISFIYGEKKISMTPEELGVKPDLDRTISAIPIHNFTGTNPAILATSLLTTRDLPLVFSLDYQAASDKIGENLGLNGDRARNARLVRAEDGFAIEPEKTGTAIDETLIAASIREDVSSLKSSPVIVVTAKEVPRITASALEKQKPRLEALINNDVTLQSDGKKLLFKTADHLDVIEYKEKTELQIKDLGLSLPIALGENQAQSEPGDGAKLVSGLELAINREKAMPFLTENLLKDIELPTSGVTVTRAGDGKINIEGKGEDGKKVPEGRLMAAMGLAINKGVATIPVPVVTEKAPIKISSDLQELGIRELLATGYTTYFGSPPNRMHNINVGIKKYNGVLVKPGEEFSFNNILGEVDAKNGYLPEKVIKKNKAELEYGGGICQVSTTLYRAILLAGLPVTERNPHSWKVAYYGQVLGHGLDATIYIGVSDVKFINDTPGYLLIQSYSEGAQAYFKFYGTSDGRVMELDGPYGGGLHYKWYRTVKKDGEEIKETIISNYKPIPPPDPPAEKPKEVAQSPAPQSTL